MKLGYVLSTLLCASFFCQAQTNYLSGGGDLNPDLKAPAKAQSEWQDMRVGLSVHWGPSSLGGKEIGWSRSKQIPTEEYDGFYKRFAPDKFDADEWCKLLQRWGMRYVSPTAKHHDGFALWFSDYSAYDMENAGRKVDIMAELKRACDKQGLVLGAYYSNIDWYHPDWTPNDYGGPGPLFPQQADSPKLERYFTYMENQVCELIRKYDLAFIQFDGEWDETYTHEVGSRLYRRFHEVKPDILLNSRIDVGRRAAGPGNHIEIDGATYAGDFQDRERLVNYGNNITQWCDHPWQAWVTIDKRQWSYNPAPQLMRADELIKDLIHVIGCNGNYMINLGPRPDGSFDPQQIALMDTLGMWLNKHADMVYGTRGGPYYPFPGGVSTRKDNKAWILVTDPTLTKLKLPTLPQKIDAAIAYHSRQQIKMEETGEYTVFTLPEVCTLAEVCTLPEVSASLKAAEAAGFSEMTGVSGVGDISGDAGVSDDAGISGGADISGVSRLESISDVSRVTGVAEKNPVRIIELTFKEKVQMCPVRPNDLYKPSKEKKPEGYY